MEDPSLAASLPWPPEPLEASDEDSLLNPTAAAAAAANSHALAAAAAMAAGSIAGSLGSQSPKVKQTGSSAPVIIGKDGKPYIPDNQERRSNALAALKLICDSPVFLPHLELLFAMQDAQGMYKFNYFTNTIELKCDDLQLFHLSEFIPSIFR